MVKGKKKMSKQPPSSNQELWPDLPQPILYQIGRNPSLMLEIYSKPITKSWRSESRKHSKSSNLCLELSYFQEQEYSQIKPHTLNITFKLLESPMFYGYRFLGCSHGLLISKRHSDCGLYDPVSYEMCLWNVHMICGNYFLGRLRLPEWDNRVPFVFTALSARHKPFVSTWRGEERNDSTLIVLTGISYPAFAYKRIRDLGNWIKRESNMDDPNDQKGKPLKFSNGIWFEGKFYALSLQGTLAVIEDVNNDLTVTCLGKKRAIPCIGCAHFKECLVESDGKIWLIFLISKSRIKVVNFVEVYELDIERLTWVKKDDLKNKTLFVGDNCCMFTSGDKVRYKGNCVYVIDTSSDGWWVFDMKIGSVSPCCIFSNPDE